MSQGLTIETLNQDNLTQENSLAFGGLRRLILGQCKNSEITTLITSDVPEGKEPIGHVAP